MTSISQSEGTALTASDIECLQKSYWTPEMIAAAEIYRVDSVTGAECVGRTPKASINYAGIIFPYFWPGEKRARQLRLRRDQPDLEQSNGKVKEKNKYLSPPGRASLLYFPPGTNPEHLQDTGVAAIITEGEKKAGALQRFVTEDEEHRLIIGLAGVWNFRGVVGVERDSNGHRTADIKGIIPDIERIAWKDREVEIVFDANVKSKPEVAAARRDLAKELIARGAHVRMIDLPEIEGINGIDDLLYLQGHKTVSEIFEAERTKAIQRQVKTMAGNITFTVSDKGVYASDVETGDKTWICSPLYIEADTRDGTGENWGRLLRFSDPDGREHKWAMPMSLLSGDGRMYREALLNMGLVISPISKARNLLEFYLSTKPSRKVRCVQKIGWHHGAFVMPNETIGGDDGEEIYLQAQETNNLLQMSGSLDEWREHIGHYCQKNSRLAFAVSIAFASSLLALIGEEGGGVHFRGETTEGKTTALYVAGSVWGGGADKGFLKRWKATGNGLEHVAACHNDSLLCLDEIAECDAREVGSIAYMLGNGQGKIRSHRGYGNRPTAEWRLLFVSSGEVRLSDLMAQNGQRVKGGQEVRFVNIESNAGCGFGLFEELHGFTGGAALSKHLVEAARRYYGTPIRHFLTNVTAEQDEVKRRAKAFIRNFVAKHVPPGAGSEVGRVAHRFGLAAFAGEWASLLGITGWEEGEAISASAKLLNEWLTDRGTQGSSEEENAIRQVRAFLEAHGSSRFQSRDDERVINRVGFREIDSDGNVAFLVMPENFRREVCAGFDPETVARALHNRGYLTRPPGRVKGYLTQRRVPGMGRVCIYYILDSIFDSGTDFGGVDGVDGVDTPNK